MVQIYEMYTNKDTAGGYLGNYVDKMCELISHCPAGG